MKSDNNIVVECKEHDNEVDPQFKAIEEKVNCKQHEMRKFICKDDTIECDLCN